MLPHRAILVAAVVAAGCGQAADPPAPALLSGERVRGPAERIHGSAGCATLGCHGALDTTDRTWRNAATVWQRFDPHARAGQTLYEPAANDIRVALGEPRPAHETPRCLACHVTPALAAAPADDAYAAARRRDGVGCEACHTRPGRGTGDWVEAHTRGWTADGLAHCYDNCGMNWLNDARGRAAACVGCHVGAPAADGVPVRDVTHDLIAAGHPRLNFDYGTYLAALPAHWTERTRERTAGRATPRPSGAHAEAWAVGRFEAARAAAELLADRAARAERGGPWPEFAGYDCYSCHHPIRPGAPRRAAGRLVWNRAELPLFLLAAVADDGGTDDLTGLLACRCPEPESVGAAARRLANRLAAAAPPADLRGCVQDALPALAAADWDDQARAYYALAAVARDRRPGAPPAPEQTATADRLRFPRTPRANSPVGHDPAAAAAALAAWAAALR